MYTLDISLLRKNNGFQPAVINDYSVDEDNAACLDIYSSLWEAFKECEQFAPKYLNLIAVFFPDLMRISTGCVLRHREIQKADINRDAKEQYPALTRYTFCGYRELLGGSLDVHSKERFSQKPLKIPTKIFNYISKRKKKRVCFYGTVDNLFSIIKKLLASGIYSLTPSYKDIKVHIPCYEEQSTVLYTFFNKIVKQFNIPIAGEEFMHLFHTVYKEQFVLDYERAPDFDILVTGSLQIRENRVLAAGACAHDIPVISISHGEGDQLIGDEPRIGYGELSYSSFFIKCGPRGDEQFTNTGHVKSLYEFPAYIPANSNECKRIFDAQKTIQKISDISAPDYMYVPTIFVGRTRNGPYFSLPDVVYFTWQKTIHELFPHALYKSHPKLDEVHVGDIDVGFHKRVGGYFQDCFHRADVFIFDVITTAFNIAAATDKPIIYFDIGLRNIRMNVIPLIKERCIWIDARENKEINYLRSEVERQRHKELKNRFTEHYCINDTNTKREDTILETIKHTMKSKHSV